MNKAEKERSKKIEKIVRIICKSDLNAMAFTRWHTETVMIAQRKLAVLILEAK